MVRQGFYAMATFKPDNAAELSAFCGGDYTKNHLTFPDIS
jgi:hypothetical protein